MRTFAPEDVFQLAASTVEFINTSESDLKAFRDQVESWRHSVEQGRMQELLRLQSELEARETDTRSSYNAAQADAHQMLYEITTLESQLEQADRHFAKTKAKMERELAGGGGQLYNPSDDPLRTIKNLRGRYGELASHYTDRDVSALVDSVGFLLSSKRKQEYEDLVLLKHTVMAALPHVDEMLPALCDQEIAQLEDEFARKRQALEEQVQTTLDQGNAAAQQQEAGYLNSRTTALHELFSDELINDILKLEADYRAANDKVNSSNEPAQGIIELSHLEVPVDELCATPEVRAVVHQVLDRVIRDGGLPIPLPMSTEATPNWYLVKDGGSSAAEDFALSVMHDFLVHCPVGGLKFLVVDPENHGNSIAPFYDARKRLPELFPTETCTRNDQVVDLLYSLNDHIQDTLQNRLGTEYESVFDLARKNPSYRPEVQLLVIFDFPHAFDERTIDQLRPILRSGRQAGVFCVIVQSPRDDERRPDGVDRAIRSVMELSVVAVQMGDGLTARGQQLVAPQMPGRAQFSAYFSRYLLVYEGIQNRGIAFSAQVRQLVQAADDAEAKRVLNEMEEQDERFQDQYGKVPAPDADFPHTLPLCKVGYPASLFAESGGLRQIMSRFPNIRHRHDVDMLEGEVTLPLTVDMARGFNVYLKSSGDDADGALDFSHAIIWTFLSSMPVTKARLIVADEELKGNSLRPFLNLQKLVPDVFDGGICTSQDSIHDQLRKVSDHLDELIQQKLGAAYSNILEYNAASRRRAEALELLVVYNYPNGFDARSLSYLANIMRNGGKCGVSVVLCGPAAYQASRYDSTESRLRQVEELATVVSCRDGKFRLEPHDLPVVVPPQPYPDRVDAFAPDYAKMYKKVQSQGLSFSDIVGASHFDGDASAMLSIPVGVGDGESIVNLTFGTGSSHHGLIAGGTGSGKSVFLHTVLMSAMLKYSPEQLNLYLMDFKGGTEFKVYESARLPHIKLLALDAMQEFGESILEDLVSEMEDRSKLFKGVGVANLKEYVRSTGKTLPRVLVVMDEFQILFNYATNRKVANNCAELTKRLVTEGRSYGIHLLMATQSTKILNDLTLSRGTIEQMRIRVGLKCGEYDTRYLFGDKNEKSALALMPGPIGTAVLNEEYTEQQNVGFRVAYCDDETKKKYLAQIAARFADVPYDMKTFEGSRTTPVEEYLTQKGTRLQSTLPATIRLGELIKVAPPLELKLDRRYRHNLLICGANERMANNLVGLYLLSALLNANLQVYCIDGDRLIGGTSMSDLYAVFARHFGQRLKVASEEDDVFRFVKEVYRSYEDTKQGVAGARQSVLVVKDLQYVESFKKLLKGEHVKDPTATEEAPAPEPVVEEPSIMDPFASINSYFAQRDAIQASSAAQSSKNPTEMVRELADTGYTGGAFMVLSSLDYQTVNENMRFGDRALTKFPERIIFSLGENDAYNLIDGVSVASLRDNTVYFTDGVRSTFQLKPFVMMDAERLDAFLTRIL